MKGRSLPATMSVLATVMLGACNGPTVRLPVRDVDRNSDAGEQDPPDAADPDDDDQSDEADDDAACDAQNPCRDEKQTICGPLGVCVECLTDADCEADRTCDQRGDCDSADD